MNHVNIDSKRKTPWFGDLGLLCRCRRSRASFMFSVQMVGLGEQADEFTYRGMVNNTQRSTSYTPGL